MRLKLHYPILEDMVPSVVEMFGQKILIAASRVLLRPGASFFSIGYLREVCEGEFVKESPYEGWFTEFSGLKSGEP